jgi:hypothetical protein
VIVTAQRSQAQSARVSFRVGVAVADMDVQNSLGKRCFNQRERS